MSEDQDISGHDEDGVLAAEYVLGLLSPEEHEAVGERLRNEAPLRAQWRFWRARLSSLDGDFADVTPPPTAWARIERRLFPAAPQRSGALWDSVSFWRGLTAVTASIAMLAILVSVVEPRPDPNAFAAQLVAALGAQGSNVQVVALYNAESGQVRLTTISGAPVSGKDYELWAIEGNNPPKSMGVIKIDARNDVAIKPDLLAGFGPGTTLAISLEPLGGSPNGKPTEVVAAGKATPI